MIDKITPRPAKVVEESLAAAGIENMAPIVTSKNTFIAPFDNAEQPQAAYDFGLDPNNVMDYDFADATKNISTYIEEVMTALANAGANTGDTGRFQTE